jgi:nucleoside-diphosphate-sugar epimerase
MRIAMTGHLGLIGTFFKKRLEDLGNEIVLAMDNRDGVPLMLLKIFPIWRVK